MASAMALWIAVAASVVSASAADTYPKNPSVDVNEYVFRLTLSDDTDSIVGLTTIDLRLGADGLSAIDLDLIGPAAPEGLKGMQVTGVWSAGGLHEQALMGPLLPEPDRGAPARFTHAANRLRVELAGSSSSGERVFVTVAYAGVPATGLIIGDNKHGDRTFFSDNWPNKARNWLPTVDHPYDKAKSQLVVTAPGHYQVVSNGLLVEETDLGDGNRLTHWRQSVPIAPWLYMLGAARFAVQHLGDHTGVPIQTWVYAQDRDAGFYDFAYPTREALDFYTDSVGPYAYEKLANIQSNSVGGGMEAASAILYGDDSVTGTRSTRWRNVIIHEIAHQWFGNAVTEYDWDDVWLSEGFATYFTLLFIEHEYGRDEFVDGLRSARDRVMAFYASNPDYRVVHDNINDMSKITTGMQYQKGAWTLHMLRGIVGTETFWEGIRRYYARYFNAHASTDDFRRVMEEASGRDLEWFFDEWLYRGGGGLSLEGSWQYDAGARAVVLELRQPADTVYRMPLTVELQHADGARHRQVVELQTTTDRFSIDAPGEPTALVLDPDTWLLLRSTIDHIDR
jgi:aminopeptidase N